MDLKLCSTEGKCPRMADEVKYKAHDVRFPLSHPQRHASITTCHITPNPYIPVLTVVKGEINMGSFAFLPSHNYPMLTYTLPYNRPRPSDFKKTGILDLPPEIILDIFVISSVSRPRGKRQGSSTHMYNLARSCKYLYAVFKANEYVVFSRIVTGSIPQGISYDWAMKLLYLSYLEYCGIARIACTRKIHRADVKDLIQPQMYGRFLRLARNPQLRHTVALLEELLAEKEIDEEVVLDRLWRGSRGLQLSFFCLWPQSNSVFSHRPGWSLRR